MTKLRPLTIVPASAGSGKTHYIQETLAREIRENGLAPEKIVAVTFTEAAAAELRGRIRAKLVKEKLLDQALRLDQAYISTIHGFGLRLLTEFAFEAGASPLPRMLNEDEQAMLVSRSLASSERACGMMDKLDRYGYRYDFNSQRSPEDAFRESLLKFIGTLRAIGKDAGAEAFIPRVAEQIRGLYGETGVAEHLKAALLTAVRDLLRRFPGRMTDGCDLGPSVAPKVRKNHYDLKEAAKGAPLDEDWDLWNRLGNLHVYKSKSKFPDGYDQLAGAVISAAKALPLHPGPLTAALEHAGALIQAATETLGHYADHKNARGLVDFTDMLAQAHRLLCGNPEVMATFRERVSCLVIDEFQDTNPLQFAMLWSLTRQGVPTIVVGDLKQAIMGFQGADARLMGKLIEQNPASIDPRKDNYRSSKELMAWINAVSSGLFPGNYAELTPQAKFTSRLSPLEVVQACESLDKKEDSRASHTVARLHALLNDDPQQVYDKHLCTHRRLRGGDIAILCPTNKRLEYHATALRNAGIRCRLEQDGWLESSAVQLACYGLQFVADPDDLHALLYLAVVGTGPHTLQSALDEMVNGRPLTDPYLDKLRALATGMLDRPVDAVLESVISSLELHGLAARDADPPQTRANLLRLQQECRDFRDANRDAMACGGYYGAEAKTFLAWLKGRAKRDNKQPEAAVIDEDAVVLTTWHRAKGREWPVVAVCGTDLAYDPRLPATRTDYGDYNDLSALLERARIEIYPKFVAPQTNEAFVEALFKESQDSALRLLYVALTRAREKVLIEWPEYQAGKEVNSYWRLMVSQARLELAGNRMLVGGQSFACRVNPAGKDPWMIEPAGTGGAKRQYGRPAIRAGVLPMELTPEAITPSSLKGAVIAGIPTVRTARYGDSLACDLPGLAAADRGTLLHRVFEVLCGHPERHALLNDAVGGRLDPLQFEGLTAAVGAFDEWLCKELGGTGISTELPLLALNEQGSVVTGIIDLVVETPAGFWIIDHKSDLLDDLEGGFRKYLPQLQAYASTLRLARPGQSLLGVGINWISYGQVMLTA